jgi:peptide chain release factor subunit 1
MLENLIQRSIFLVNRVFSTGQLYIVNPPNPIKHFFYRCDRKFYIDEILSLYSKLDTFAVMLISGKQVKFYSWNENETKLLKSYTEDLPNQHKTGGQSAQRFERIRDERILWYCRKAIEYIQLLFTKQGVFQFKGLIIGGPAGIKEKIIKDDSFIWTTNLCKVITTTEISETTISFVINNSLDVINGNKRERNEIDKLLEMINKTDQIDLIVFGKEKVIELFKKGELSKIYVSVESDLKKIVQSIESKTIIVLIKDTIFYKNYGDCVGIKYYNDQNFADHTDDNNDEITKGNVEGQFDFGI